MGTPPVGAGRSRAHPAYEWDRPTRTPTARIVPNDPCPAGGSAGRASRRRPSRSAARARRGSSELLLCAGRGVVLDLLASSSCACRKTRPTLSTGREHPPAALPLIPIVTAGGGSQGPGDSRSL